MSDFLFRGSLAELDPAVYELTEIEAERQYRRLILIPSESTAPASVRQALATGFTNIYAEGYPDEATRRMRQSEILDYEAQLGRYRRYSDPRYYKGVEYADTVEALARRRCAELFASNGVTADQLYVNVQPLSGAPANNAVYQALVEPGDTVMGMDLLHGGHLTHGSPVNRSGKLFNIVRYGVDPETERLDYDAVEQLAIEHRPKLIIAGYSSYPWSVNWKRFREIADQVGAYLLADIAHLAGPIAAGVCRSPVGHAHAITFTTHKSLCGPRGAAILTTNPKLARLIDRAVFPGEQGGPHMNTLAAQAVAFKLAGTDTFRKLQERILKNCVALSEALASEGLRIPFGGTDTHLTNVDCASIVGEDGTPLSGDQAARILDLAGIVVNRNTIPGDRSAANPSGIRLGTTWITQRGFTEDQCRQTARLIGKLLRACRPYSVAGRSRPLSRAKVEFSVLSEVQLEVRDLATASGIDYQPPSHGYPHFFYPDDPPPGGAYAQIRIEGAQADSFLRWSTPAHPAGLEIGESAQLDVQTPAGVVEARLSRVGPDGWDLVVDSQRSVGVMSWLRSLSDGYIPLSDDDLHRKSPGPVAVRLHGSLEALPEANLIADGSDKPWFVGSTAGGGEPRPNFVWEPAGSEEPKKTALHELHRSSGAKMIPFAGWDMPVWYSSVLDEHQATRQAAGLFDVSHMGVYQVEGAQASAFLDSVVANDVSALKVRSSLYTQFLDPDAAVLDDAMVYRLDEQRYLVVVNAANDDKDWAWLNAVLAGEVCVDRARPGAAAFGRDCVLRNLRDPSAADDMRVDLALQGPKSREILLELGCTEATATQLRTLPWAGVMQGTFGGLDLVVSRTGYTGERTAYEMFIQPDRSPELWSMLLKVGEPLGLQPVGLGARDSLRTEAGLPLYGQEMAGPMGLGVGDAGFAAYVKTHKPWFVGRTAYLEQEHSRKAEVARFRFNDKGVRLAHYGDPVVDRRGRVIGSVTSCAVDQEGFLLGQAYLVKSAGAEGTPIGVYQSASAEAGKAPSALAMGDRVQVPSPATVLSRFP